MCYAVYIGTNEKQKEGEWIKGRTEIYFQELSGDEEAIKPKFTKPLIYYVGADTGCSCGFAYESEDFNDPEEQETKRSPQKLIEFIKSQTLKEDLEFYCCWEGDWSAPVEERLEIDINEIQLGLNYFGLIERQFILFKRRLNT